MTPIFWNDTLSIQPWQILSPSNSLYWSNIPDPEGSSIVEGFFSDVGYHLTLANFPTDQFGEGPIPVGTYAHVVQIDRQFTNSIANRANYPSLTNIQVGDLLVQYWQFFAYNNPNVFDNYDEHEGDILYLEVYLHRFALTQPTADAIIAIVYHHHGDGSCPPTLIPGLNNVRGTQTYVSIPPDGTPLCYLEAGGHEWWPWWSSGNECTFGPFDTPNNGHNGLKANYLTDHVLNLGQRFSPMPGDEPEMVLFFNGKWGLRVGSEGDCPLGPIQQFYPASPLFVGYVATNAPASWPTANGVGSQHFPFQTLTNALSSVEQTVMEFAPFAVPGRLLMKPGNYSAGGHEFSKPMTLEVWGPGEVTIGQ